MTLCHVRKLKHESIHLLLLFGLVATRWRVKYTGVALVAERVDGIIALSWIADSVCAVAARIVIVSKAAL